MYEPVWTAGPLPPLRVALDGLTGVVVGFRLRPMAGRTNEFTRISPSERPERLGRTGHETFLKVPLWTAVPIPPLLVELEPSVPA